MTPTNKHYLTENFTYEEFFYSATAEKKKISNHPDSINNAIVVHSNLPKLATILQLVRSLYGKAIRISSGFRNQLVNRAVGGCATSYHRLGAAADLVSSDMDGLHAALIKIQSVTYDANNKSNLFRIVPEYAASNTSKKVADWYHIQLEKVCDSYSVEDFFAKFLCATVK